MEIVLRVSDTGDQLVLDVFDLVIGAYTGRNRADVDHHIAELAALGVPPPPAVPAFFPVGSSLLQLAPVTLDGLGPSTSGEAEPVLVQLASGARFVGIGSDHTDRELEKSSIAQSKEACPKVMSPEVWSYESVVEVWDGLELSSASGEDAAAYQRGTLGQIRPVDELLSLAGASIGRSDRALVLFMGTVPLLDGEFRFATSFSAGLREPGADRALSCSYRIA